ncbi:MAG: SAM-dependent methyltransferase [Herbiconiux sp.]|uniref:class I SAM-dependent methyltransferase n=1 Tax=Herbiconiux sp. TaxID=1871186 RepID=UPI00122B1C78|nr:SAM-dependent methyltransferase [Herbiconiux sp.]TAJ48653.1 MAG: SAM-dependent methyltransferase [Herbiconiux sp.]
MDPSRRFDELIAEGEAAPIEGWDFSWFAGRATEERPSWGYSALAAERIADPAVAAVVDLQTGGGEVFAEALARASAGIDGPDGVRRPGRIPPTVWATEGWPPNLALARRALELFRGEAVLVDERARLPFTDGLFDLVLSRHPAFTNWPEIARVLAPGGTYLSQQVAAGSNRELYEFFLGPHPVGENDERSLANLVTGARAAGLSVVDAVQEATRVEFFDVGAVVHFLRKVLWTVPDFSVERYRGKLEELHRIIEAEGSFVCHSRRALVEARRS